MAHSREGIGVKIYLETQVKLYIQNLIKQGELELVTSYVLDYENSNNQSLHKTRAIDHFMKKYASLYVSNRQEDVIRESAVEIMETGVKVSEYANGHPYTGNGEIL